MHYLCNFLWLKRACAIIRFLQLWVHGPQWFVWWTIQTPTDQSVLRKDCLGNNTGKLYSLNHAKYFYERNDFMKEKGLPHREVGHADLFDEKYNQKCIITMKKSVEPCKRCRKDKGSGPRWFVWWTIQSPDLLLLISVYNIQGSWFFLFFRWYNTNNNRKNTKFSTLRERVIENHFHIYGSCP